LTELLEKIEPVDRADVAVERVAEVKREIDRGDWGA